MQKKLPFMLFFIILMMLFAPIKTCALDLNGYDNFISDGIYILDDEYDSPEYLDDWMDDYNQEQDCSGANSILGDPNDEDSVAWLLQQILNYIKIIGPILVVVLSSIDFAQVILKGDDESMKKSAKKLGWRLVLAACLFFIPTLVQAILNIFGMSSDPTCGIH